MDNPRRATTIMVQTTDLLTVAEAAGELGVHRMTVYRWMDSGRIINIRLGNILYVPRSEVERLKHNTGDGKL